MSTGGWKQAGPLFREVMRPRLVPGRPATQLGFGLVLFGFSLALLVRARLGLAPWDVLHQGIAIRTGMSLGTVVVVVSMLVLLAWIPLKQRPGTGTVANALLVGVVVDAGLRTIPPVDSLNLQVTLLVLGTVLNAFGTALYIGAGLGAGTRDGLMVGIAARGHSLPLVRTVIEVMVLAIGFVLGGTVGIGTIVFAFAIGPLVHRLLPLFTIQPPSRNE